MGQSSNEVRRYYLEDEFANLSIVKSNEVKENISIVDENIDFDKLCVFALAHINTILNIKTQNDTDTKEDNPKQTKASKEAIKIQYDALRGVPEQVDYFISHIEEFLKKEKYQNVPYPKWYSSLAEAIYHEVWGLGCISNFFTKKFDKSSSAKIIGERVYYLVNGVLTLQPQRMKPKQLAQLKKNMLLNAPESNNRDSYIELNFPKGERATMFTNQLTKQGQDVVVLRKYTADELTWEEQAALSTIPVESIDFFKLFSRVGFNVIFTGQVRSGKTTWLIVWQKGEKKTAEGLMIEVTNEIRLHELMPSAPNMQLLMPEDEEERKKLIAHVMRSDANYIIMAEAREGNEFELMVKVANKGTHRCKTTMHSTDGKNVVLDITDEIINYNGNGTQETTIFKVANSFQFVIELTQTYENNSVKKLKAIHEVRHDRAKGLITSVPICLYYPLDDRWEFNPEIGKDKEEFAQYEDYNAYIGFKKELDKLAELYPMASDKKKAHIIYKKGN